MQIKEESKKTDWPRKGEIKKPSWPQTCVHRRKKQQGKEEKKMNKEQKNYENKKKELDNSAYEIKMKKLKSGWLNKRRHCRSKLDCRNYYCKID